MTTPALTAQCCQSKLKIDIASQNCQKIHPNFFFKHRHSGEDTIIILISESNKFINDLKFLTDPPQNILEY